jgi:hypothetical protein
MLKNHSDSSSLVGSTTANKSVIGTEITVTSKGGKRCWRMHGTVLAYAHARSFGAKQIGWRTDGFRARNMRMWLYVAVHPSLSGLGATVTGCLTGWKGGFFNMENDQDWEKDCTCWRQLMRAPAPLSLAFDTWAYTLLVTWSMMELKSLLIFCMMLGGNHIVNNLMDCVSVVTNIVFSSFFPFLIECALSPQNLTFPLFYHGGNWNILSLMWTPLAGERSWNFHS